MDNTDNLTLLGNQNTQYTFTGPNSSVLETFPNKYPSRDYVVCHDTTEFTSLCPKTSQPDFAHVHIEFVPDAKCVESKSLKLYLFSYRNVGAFMETICNQILDDLVACMQPRKIEVVCKFNARGGVITSVKAHYSKVLV